MTDTSHGGGERSGQKTSFGADQAAALHDSGSREAPQGDSASMLPGSHAASPLASAARVSADGKSGSGQTSQHAVDFNLTDSEAEEQEWIQQGAPRWLIRELEGDSSGRPGCLVCACGG